MTSTIRVKVGLYQQGNENAAIVPVTVPDLAEVRAYAYRLHDAGQAISDVAWGWPVHYDPEVRETQAELQVPNGHGGYTTEVRPYWSPASFTIGESGIWFFSLLWEHGRDHEPVEFLDDRNVLAHSSNLP